MSEFHQIEVEILTGNEDCLLKALEAVGYKPIVHEKAQYLYGYQGDRREQVAHIIIPRSQVGAASNDIGFERMPSGKYRLHVSEFDQSRWNPKQIKLMQYYGVAVVMKQTATSDYSLVEQEIQKDGTIRLRLRINNQY